MDLDRPPPEEAPPAGHATHRDDMHEAMMTETTPRDDPGRGTHIQTKSPLFQPGGKSTSPAIALATHLRALEDHLAHIGKPPLDDRLPGDLDCAVPLPSPPRMSPMRDEHNASYRAERKISGMPHRVRSTGGSSVHDYAHRLSNNPRIPVYAPGAPHADARSATANGYTHLPPPVPSPARGDAARPTAEAHLVHAVQTDLGNITGAGRQGRYAAENVEVERYAPVAGTHTNTTGVCGRMQVDLIASPLIESHASHLSHPVSRFTPPPANAPTQPTAYGPVTPHRPSGPPRTNKELLSKSPAKAIAPSSWATRAKQQDSDRRDRPFVPDLSKLADGSDRALEVQLRRGDELFPAESTLPGDVEMGNVEMRDAEDALGTTTRVDRVGVSPRAVEPLPQHAVWPPASDIRAHLQACYTGTSTAADFKGATGVLAAAPGAHQTFLDSAVTFPPPKTQALASGPGTGTESGSYLPAPPPMHDQEVTGPPALKHDLPPWMRAPVQDPQAGLLRHAGSPSNHVASVPWSAHAGGSGSGSSGSQPAANARSGASGATQYANADWVNPAKYNGHGHSADDASEDIPRLHLQMLVMSKMMTIAKESLDMRQLIEHEPEEVAELVKREILRTFMQDESPSPSSSSEEPWKPQDFEEPAEDEDVTDDEMEGPEDPPEPEEEEEEEEEGEEEEEEGEEETEESLDGEGEERLASEASASPLPPAQVDVSVSHTSGLASGVHDVLAIWSSRGAPVPHNEPVCQPAPQPDVRHAVLQQAPSVSSPPSWRQLPRDNADISLDLAVQPIAGARVRYTSRVSVSHFPGLLRNRLIDLPGKIIEAVVAQLYGSFESSDPTWRAGYPLDQARRFLEIEAQPGPHPRNETKAIWRLTRFVAFLEGVASLSQGWDRCVNESPVWSTLIRCVHRQPSDAYTAASQSSAPGLKMTREAVPSVERDARTSTPPRCLACLLHWQIKGHLSARPHHAGSATIPQRPAAKMLQTCDMGSIPVCDRHIGICGKCIMPFVSPRQGKLSSNREPDLYGKALLVCPDCRLDGLRRLLQQNGHAAGMLEKAYPRSWDYVLGAKVTASSIIEALDRTVWAEAQVTWAEAFVQPLARYRDQRIRQLDDQLQSLYREQRLSWPEAIDRSTAGHDNISHNAKLKRQFHSQALDVVSTMFARQLVKNGIFMSMADVRQLCARLDRKSRSELSDCEISAIYPRVGPDEDGGWTQLALLDFLTGLRLPPLHMDDSLDKLISFHLHSELKGPLAIVHNIIHEFGQPYDEVSRAKALAMTSDDLLRWVRDIRAWSHTPSDVGFAYPPVTANNVQHCKSSVSLNSTACTTPPAVVEGHGNLAGYSPKVSDKRKVAPDLVEAPHKRARSDSSGSQSPARMGTETVPGTPNRQSDDESMGSTSSQYGGSSTTVSSEAATAMDSHLAQAAAAKSPLMKQDRGLPRSWVCKMVKTMPWPQPQQPICNDVEDATQETLDDNTQSAVPHPDFLLPPKGLADRAITDIWRSLWPEPKQGPCSCSICSRQRLVEGIVEPSQARFESARKSPTTRITPMYVTDSDSELQLFDSQDEMDLGSDSEEWAIRAETCPEPLAFRRHMAVKR